MCEGLGARVKSSAVEIKDYYHKKARIKKIQVSLFAHSLRGQEDRRCRLGLKKQKVSESLLLSLSLSGGKKKTPEIERVMMRV